MSTEKRGDSLESVLNSAIRAAIDAGWTYRGIGDASGVPFPTIQRFATGARVGLSLQTVDKLVSHFGIRVGKPTRAVKSPPNA